VSKPREKPQPAGENAGKEPRGVFSFSEARGNTAPIENPAKNEPIVNKPVPELVQDEKIDKMTILDFGEIHKLPERTRLRDLVGKVILIESFEVRKSRFGDYAVIKLADGTETYTFSTVVIRQLQEIAKYMDGKHLVKTCVEKRPRYIALAPADRCK
jgi:hypothetical protein